MTDLVFSAPTVQDALADAASVLGVDRTQLRYVVLDAPEEETGRGARIAVIPARADHATTSVPEEPAGVAEDASDVWAELATALEKSLGVSIERSDSRDAEIVHLDLPPGAIAPNATSLKAVAHLLERAAAKASGRRVVVESEALKRLCEEELCDLARRLAEQVRSDGEPRVVPCRNSYERRLVHMTLADVAGVRSESEGEGPERQLVIFSAATDGEAGGA